MDTDSTKIGEVRKISGSTINVSLDDDIAGASPLYEGRLRQVSQIGSFVKIPRGLLDILAVVSKVGVSDFSNEEEGYNWQPGEWNLQLQLLGQIDKGSEKFNRGVGSYPEINDPVHFITADTLRAVFPEPAGDKIKIGNLSNNRGVPVTIDLKEIVVKHSAVFGSTGSGKTSTVASLLQNIERQGWKNSNIIVIDPHGEYSTALDGIASVLSVLPSEDENQLEVPCWALPPDDILKVFFERGGPNQNFRSRFSELVVNQRRNLVDDADWLSYMDQSSVNPDTPIPFDIRQVWHSLSYENRETIDEHGDSCVTNEGGAEELNPPAFEDYGQGGQPPNKGDNFNSYGTSPEYLRRALEDPRFQFFQRPRTDIQNQDPLESVIQEWLGNENPISVLDFSGVPESAAQAAVGIILKFLFEISTRARNPDEGIGRQDPVLVIVEEAHRFVGNDARIETKDAVNRIAKEGRKYGIGLMVVTQRPSEVPSTTLSQCGTLISLRLSSQGDQATVTSALPETTLGISESLSSLRKLEAIISGEAIKLPSRVFVDEPDPFPEADDPPIETWKMSPEKPSLAGVLRDWRGTYN